MRRTWPRSTATESPGAASARRCQSLATCWERAAAGCVRARWRGRGLSREFPRPRVLAGFPSVGLSGGAGLPAGRVSIMARPVPPLGCRRGPRFQSEPTCRQCSGTPETACAPASRARDRNRSLAWARNPSPCTTSPPTISRAKSRLGNRAPRLNFPRCHQLIHRKPPPRKQLLRRHLCFSVSRRVRYKVTLRLEGRDLPYVAFATYQLHRSFRVRTHRIDRTVSNPDCSLTIWTWGLFRVGVVIHLKSGQRIRVHHDLHYDDAIREAEPDKLQWSAVR